MKLSYDRYFRTQLFNDIRKDPNELNKLRTFRQFKTVIKYEPSLNSNLPRAMISDYTKLHISAHKLNIETARYIKAPVAQRTQQKLLARRCTNFDLMKDEDEKHFLLECPKYNTIRQEFLENIFSQCKNTKSLKLDQLLLWLMSNEEFSITTRTIKFLSECVRLRNQ